MRSVIVLVLLGLSLGTLQETFAEETTQSHVKLKEALENRKFEEDKRITDIELKAQAGSLSRYSLKFDLSYSGPPVNNLSDPEMPNPDNRPRNNRTSLGGFMGLRYRVNSREAWNASTGLRWFSPYHQVAGEHVNKRPGEKDYEIANPAVSYDWTYLLGGVQMRSSLKGSVTTADYYVERGQQASAGVSQSAKYTLGGSRWILGGLFDLDFYRFNRDFRRSDGRMSNYYFSLIPSLEYKLTDRFNLKTSIAYSFGNLRMADNWWIWDEQQPIQRVGFGWGITRDIYFNPYLSFFTERPAIRTTSASFSTVFSIF